MTPSVSLPSLEDAIEAVRVAIALGYEIPAIAGTQVFNAEVTSRIHNSQLEEMDEWERSLGTFTSRAAAIVAVRNWVILQWFQDGSHPLLGIKKRDKIVPEFQAYSRFSDEEILDAYYTKSISSYVIFSPIIEDAPSRIGGDGDAESGNDD